MMAERGGDCSGRLQPYDKLGSDHPSVQVRSCQKRIAGLTVGGRVACDARKRTSACQDFGPGFPPVTETFDLAWAVSGSRKRLPSDAVDRLHPLGNSPTDS